MTTTPITDLTVGTLNGTGVFDALMRASKAHLDDQYERNRIKGPEYATVYLGQIQAAMSNAMVFLAQRQKLDLEAQVLAEQLRLIKAQADRAEAEVATVAKTLLQMDAQLALTQAQKANEILQGNVLVAQECLLKAQFDNTVATVLKTKSEEDLLKQKIATEKAQIMELGVDDNSVIGKQKKLYEAQTAGFKSDSIQKATKIWVDSWQSRRMTDDGTVADGVNKLYDVTGGRLMDKLLTDVGA